MIEIVPYRPEWTGEFEQLGNAIQSALGDHALTIHHIGSTSVEGLWAKDVIDIQLTVADLNAPVGEGLTSVGFTARDQTSQDHCPPGMALDEDELQKRMFGYSGPRRVHLHVRQAGRFNQGYPLLRRDYLRSHPLAAAAYAEIKRQLAHYFPEDEGAYCDIKDPVFDVLMAGARDWAQFTGWQTPPSDIER